MSTKEYMLILQRTDWDEGLSIEETEKVIGQYTEWFQRLAREGTITGGKPLSAGGRVVSKQGDRVSDGPFIESKEAIGGFITINAASIEEAVEIVKTFPPVQMGVHVEVREFSAICPVSQRLEKRLAGLKEPAGA